MMPRMPETETIRSGRAGVLMPRSVAARHRKTTEPRRSRRGSSASRFNWRGLVAAVAVATAAATTTVPAASRPVLTGPSLVDRQGSALEVGAVHGGDGRLGPVRHLDEGEPAAPAGLPVRHHLGAHHRPVLAERLGQVLVRRLERDVSDIQLLTHALPSWARWPRLTALRPTRSRMAYRDGVRCGRTGRNDLGEAVRGKLRADCPKIGERCGKANQLSTERKCTRPFDHPTIRWAAAEGKGKSVPNSPAARPATITAWPSRTPRTGSNCSNRKPRASCSFTRFTGACKGSRRLRGCPASSYERRSAGSGASGATPRTPSVKARNWPSRR